MKFFTVLFLCAVAIACVSAQLEPESSGGTSMGGTSMMDSVVAQFKLLFSQFLAVLQKWMELIDVAAISSQIQSGFSGMRSSMSSIGFSAKASGQATSVTE